MKITEIKVGEEYAVGGHGRYSNRHRYRVLGIEKVPAKNSWEPATTKVKAVRLFEENGTQQTDRPEFINAAFFIRPWAEQAEINAAAVRRHREEARAEQEKDKRIDAMKARIAALGIKVNEYGYGDVKPFGMTLDDFDRLLGAAEAATARVEGR